MFFTKEMIVFTESSHFVLLRFLPDIRTPKALRASSCSCQGQSIKVCDVHVSKLAEHLRLLCLGKQDVSGFALATCYEYKKVPGKESFFAKDE